MKNYEFWYKNIFFAFRMIDFQLFHLVLSDYHKTNLCLWVSDPAEFIFHA